MLTNISKRWLLFQWNVQLHKHSVWERDIVPSSSLMLGCGGVGILSVYGAVGLLGSAAGARSVETHAGSAMTKSSLLTELSSCMCVWERRGWGGEEEVRELRIFCAQNETHPPHYSLDITRFSTSPPQLLDSQSPQTWVKINILFSALPVRFIHAVICMM